MKTKILWVRSHSAVNVRAVCGVDVCDNPDGDRGGIRGVAGVAKKEDFPRGERGRGSGEGGNTSLRLVEKPLRRIFLTFNGATSTFLASTGAGLQLKDSVGDGLTFLILNGATLTDYDKGQISSNS